MWLLRGALLGVVLVALHDAAADPQYEDTEDDDGDDVDFDDHYDSEDIIAATPVTATDEPGARSRVRRFGDFNPGERTLSLEEISEVKGAIKELLAGRYQELTNTFTTETRSSATDANEPATKEAFTGLTKTDNVDPTKYYEDIIEEIIDNAKRQGLYIPTRKANDVIVTNNYIHVEGLDNKLKTEATPMKAARQAIPESGDDMQPLDSGNYITNVDVDENNNYFQVRGLPNIQKTNARVTRSLSKASPERDSDMPMPVEFEEDVVNIDADENNNYVHVEGLANNPNTEVGPGESARLEPFKAKPEVISVIPLPAVLMRTIYVEEASRSTGKNDVTENYENDVSKTPKNYNTHHTNFLRQLDTTDIDNASDAAVDTTHHATAASNDTTTNNEHVVGENVDNAGSNTTNMHNAADAETTIETTTTPSTRRRTRRRRTTTTPTTTTVTTTTVTTSTTTPAPEFDIPALVDLIANLTYDFESNITLLFNKTLQKYNIPTCRPPETTTTERVIFDLRNATVVSKCFVCGMHVEGIPPNALCADAFAGDFLPLVPVDQRAKGQLAHYRKYCRYLDVNGFYENATEPRSIFGRFTGGCSVRWTDLSGVYTQRACRNTRRAMTGRHFGSKRMAKLEMSLKDFDNGCIISPMSSLVPLSRGISLYARFHACVCTGNWCNAASPNQPWTAFIAVGTLLDLTMSIGSSIGYMFLS